MRLVITRSKCTASLVPGSIFGVSPQRPCSGGGVSVECYCHRDSLAQQCMRPQCDAAAVCFVGCFHTQHMTRVDWFQS